MAEDREVKAMETTLAALKPLSREERERVVTWLVGKLGVAARTSEQSSDVGSQAHLGGKTDGQHGGLGEIKKFLKDKRPDDDVARATALAYYLTHAKGEPMYNTSDLSKARVEAALTNFNVSRAVSNAQRAGYLTTAGKKGTYQVTSFGEAIVEAMPDAEAVKQVRAQRTGRRRAKRSSTKKGAGTEA